MTEFILNKTEMWMHQNRAEYTGAFFDGTCIDNYVVSCKRGYAFFYERFINCWQAVYHVKFAPYKDLDACMALWNEFHERQDAAEAYVEGR